MPTVYLPTEHSEAELVLAGQVAEALECSALYVTWSSCGYGGPDSEAVLVSPPIVAPADTPAPRGSALSRACSRVSAFLASVFSAPGDVEHERRAG